jgi:hypothetical protein
MTRTTTPPPRPTTPAMPQSIDDKPLSRRELALAALFVFLCWAGIVAGIVAMWRAAP